MTDEGTKRWNGSEYRVVAFAGTDQFGTKSGDTIYIGPDYRIHRWIATSTYLSPNLVTTDYQVIEMQCDKKIDQSKFIFHSPAGMHETNEFFTDSYP